MSVRPHIAIITLGVRDFARARRFYSEGLGWPIQQEQGEWVCFSLGDGSSALTLYPWDELADEAGMPADGSGFRGITFAYNVRGPRSASMKSLPKRKPAVAGSPRLRSAGHGEATAATSPIPKATSGRSRPELPNCHSLSRQNHSVGSPLPRTIRAGLESKAGASLKIDVV